MHAATALAAIMRQLLTTMTSIAGCHSFVTVSLVRLGPPSQRCELCFRASQPEVLLGAVRQGCPLQTHQLEDNSDASDAASAMDSVRFWPDAVSTRLPAPSWHPADDRGAPAHRPGSGQATIQQTACACEHARPPDHATVS
jgi:hypothetical protein